MYPLIVQDGAVTNSEGLNFDLTEKGPNAHGSVIKDDQPVADVWVSAHKVTGEEQWFNGKTDGDGKFSLTLLDGEYQIDGVWVESRIEMVSITLYPLRYKMVQLSILMD